MRLAFAIFAAITWCLPAAAQQVLDSRALQTQKKKKK